MLQVREVSLPDVPGIVWCSDVLRFVENRHPFLSNKLALRMMIYSLQGRRHS
jgi:hypothetical protein